MQVNEEIFNYIEPKATIWSYKPHYELRELKRMER